jgi:hypothetical protein
MTNRYKITILAAAAVVFALFSASNSFAQSGGCGAINGSQDFTCTYSGGTADTLNGATIMVTLSPGVLLTYHANATASLFALESQNNSVNPVNRNEYGIASDYSGYYMKPNTADTLDTITFSTSPETAYSAFSSWTPMGGS